RIRPGLCLRRADERARGAQARRRGPRGGVTSSWTIEGSVALATAGERATRLSWRRRAKDASGVPGLAGEHPRIDAEHAQGAVVLGFQRHVEDQLRIGRAVQPSVGLDLAFELARAPAGIAERQQGAVRALAAGDG